MRHHIARCLFDVCLSVGIGALRKTSRTEFGHGCVLATCPRTCLRFLDAFSHLYKRVCRSVRPSVGPSVGPSHTSWISEKWEFRAEFEQNCIWNMLNTMQFTALLYVVYIKKHFMNHPLYYLFHPHLLRHVCFSFRGWHLRETSFHHHHHGAVSFALISDMGFIFLQM